MDNDNDSFVRTVDVRKIYLEVETRQINYMLRLFRQDSQSKYAASVVLLCWDSIYKREIIKGAIKINDPM